MKEFTHQRVYSIIQIRRESMMYTPSSHQPSGLRVTYANIQTWTDEKQETLRAHLTKSNPDVILLSDIGKTDKKIPIKIFQYLVFAANKNNENSAGVAIAIRKGLEFKCSMCVKDYEYKENLANHMS